MSKREDGLRVRFTKLTSKTWAGQQSWEYEALWRMKLVGLVAGPEYRIKIDIDRDFYDFQSHAIAKGFDTKDSRWNVIATIPYPHMVTLSTVNTSRMGVADDAFEEDERYLLNEAKMVLFSPELKEEYVELREVPDA